MEKNTLTDSRPLGVGDNLPRNISFQVFHKGEIKEEKFSSFQGRWLVLFFYPGDFTFICPTELSELSERYESFKKLGVEIISFSTDTAVSYTHLTLPTIYSV